MTRIMTMAATVGGKQGQEQGIWGKDKHNNQIKTSSRMSGEGREECSNNSSSAATAAATNSSSTCSNTNRSNSINSSNNSISSSNSSKETVATARLRGGWMGGQKGGLQCNNTQQSNNIVQHPLLDKNVPQCKDLNKLVLALLSIQSP